LYIWDGIASIEEEQHDTTTGTTTIPVRWGGTWVPVVNVPDATRAGVPHRDAFQEFVASECKFRVTGTATRMTVAATDSEKKRKREEDGTTDDQEQEDDVEQFYVVSLTEGDGWDMLEEAATAAAADVKSSEPPHTPTTLSTTTQHHDTVHDVLVKTLRWSGNQLDQSQDLLVAHGRNAFGAFVSVGWQRPGCRWTVARRYLPDDDPRTTWSLPALYTAMVDGRRPDDNDDDNEKMTTTLLTIIPTTGQRVLTIPPWKANAVLHHQYQHGSKNHQVQTKKKKT